MPAVSARQHRHKLRHLSRRRVAWDGEFVAERPAEQELGQGCFRRAGDDELGEGRGSRSSR